MNKPLDNWPALRTSSTEVAEHTLCSTFGARNFEVASTREDFCAHANYKQLSALSLSYCSYTRPVTIEFPEAPFFRQAFSVVGAGMFFIGDREYMISAERSAVVHPGVPLRAEFSGDFEQLLLRIDEFAWPESSAHWSRRQ